MAVVGAPGTAAYFTDQATAVDATITTASAELRVSTVVPQIATAVYPGGPAARLHPTAAPTVTNSGAVPLSVSVTPTGEDAAPSNLAGTVIISVALQSSPSCAATPTSGTWSGTSGVASGTIATLTPGQTRTLCAWQQLPTSAPDGTFGQTAPITLTLTGVQQ